MSEALRASADTTTFGAVVAAGGYTQEVQYVFSAVAPGAVRWSGDGVYYRVADLVAAFRKIWPHSEPPTSFRPSEDTDPRCLGLGNWGWRHDHWVMTDNPGELGAVCAQEPWELKPGDHYTSPEVCWDAA